MTLLHIPHFKMIVPKKVLELYSYKMELLSILPAKPSPLENLTIRTLNNETLGTIWGMEKFHYFLYGNKFILETDQKPLLPIH